ncbi:hypothetical protein NQ314_006292 [Rhamnusium bicolor]|uniref:PiggyBac transposable element-derived protein domain-containing protein n=1 Tax=Rhamnusium bicolor TaxID=1586634 RepID=A0AAV8Z5T2_9CUCU|nr:hypothetical protein NQ314_006292 [Rhamnusium bicolor]
MLNSVVVYTNQTIAVKSAEYVDKHEKENHLDEMLGLLYLAGFFRSDHQNLEDLWASDGTGVDIFRATMAVKRFQFLLACFRFDDRASRTNRRSLDKLAPIRAVFDRFVDHCLQSYAPSESVTIVEKLEEFRGCCGFHQYIPNKPAKHGLKFFAPVD